MVLDNKKSPHPPDRIDSQYAHAASYWLTTWLYSLLNLKSIQSNLTRKEKFVSNSYLLSYQGCSIACTQVDVHILESILQFHFIVFFRRLAVATCTLPSIHDDYEEV